MMPDRGARAPKLIFVFSRKTIKLLETNHRDCNRECDSPVLHSNRTVENLCWCCEFVKK